MKFDFIQAVQLMQQGKTVKWNDGNLIFKIINNIVYIKNINDNSWKECQGTLNDIINFNFEEYIENPKIDYSKWIGRYNDRLFIKGKKYLKSYNYNESEIIEYSDLNFHKEDKLNYETVEMKDLKYGDVVDLFPEDTNKNLRNFGIFIGNYEQYYIFQKLDLIKTIESIRNDYYDCIIKVNRFLRE